MQKLVLLVLTGLMIWAQPSQKPLGEPARRDWFKQSKFGIFVHWGPYSVIGRHEWARHFYQIPQAEYDQYARQFNPVKFNPDDWTKLFADAGAKYVVITSKHHDGFSIYRSKVSEYDMEITPYAGDPIKMLADSAKKRDLRLGFYHSIMDWKHPLYTPKRAWEVANPNEGGDLNLFLDYMKLQLKELLTEYGDVAVMWFDGEWEHKDAGKLRETEIAKFINDLQPNTLINDRLWNRREGNPANYGTPEQFVPATGIRGKNGEELLWESCVTINEESWGYNQYETQFKTPRYLIRMLIEVVSKGGNLLLNVGPKPDGTIQEEFVVRLQEMGRWMKINGESIYGTTASPFSRLPFFGRATTKGNQLYLHVFQWPKDGKLLVPGLQNKVSSAELLANKAKLKTQVVANGVLIDLPGPAPDSAASVIRLTLDGAPKVAPFFLESDATGQLVAGAESCEIETEFEQQARKENLLGHVYVMNWKRSADVPTWRIRVAQGGRYAVDVSYAAHRNSKDTPFTVTLKGETTAIAKGIVVPTGNENVFQQKRIGEVNLEPGEYTLTIRADNKAGVSAMAMEKVVLQRLGQ
jgi:alpha-L-fucosidase